MRESHLNRAICGRVENIQGLPPPFRLNRPSMHQLMSSETRQPSKAPSFALIWTTGQNDFEIVNTTIGKPDGGVISKVCKHEFMKRFLSLVGVISSLSGVEANPPTLYSEAKEAVNSYKVIFVLGLCWI